MRKCGPFDALGVLLILTVTAGGGCIGQPHLDNPTTVRSDGSPPICENPVLVAPGEPGPDSYAETFERILDVVDDYFPIAYANRYDGRIVCTPRIAPGFERLWMPGSPSRRERLLSTLQTYRHRCQVQIRAAEQGGYLVQVFILKDLYDPAGAAGVKAPSVFQEAASIDRNYEVVDPINTSTSGERWINKGRDMAFEQLLLRLIQHGQ
jgi:hypothetical protein